jgi:Bacterial low temperature requirement A protein (LtrA)
MAIAHIAFSTNSPSWAVYDLAVVVLVGQAAHHLAEHLTWRGLGEFAVVFTLVWIAWTNGCLHHELHGHDDARSRTQRTHHPSSNPPRASRRPVGRRTMESVDGLRRRGPPSTTFSSSR